LCLVPVRVFLYVAPFLKHYEPILYKRLSPSV